MKRRKLKKYVIPTGILSLFVLTMYLTSLMFKEDITESYNPSYVNDSIIEKNQPVINTTTKMIKPFTEQLVEIGKSFYDYQSDASKQENSIIYHENTYIQNSGIDYKLEQEFDVISVLDGKVTNVKQDELLGNVVEIEHSNNYITTYQSLNNIKVKKGDTVTQGQVIGTSGTNKLDKEMGNHLHFELNINGQIVNPENYIDKEIETGTKKE